MSIWRIVGDHLEPVEGVVLTAVHPADRCEGRPCVVHAPTDHLMRSWPLRWRNDRVMFERVCPHDIGHPDPDQFARWAELLDPEEAAAEATHGCDGCCGGSSHRTRPERDSAALGDPGARTEGREAVSGELGADSDPAERLRLAADLTEWAALAGPQIAGPLAAWLRAEADDVDLIEAGNLLSGCDKATTVRALALADVILSEEDQ